MCGPSTTDGVFDDAVRQSLRKFSFHQIALANTYLVGFWDGIDPMRGVDRSYDNARYREKQSRNWRQVEAEHVAMTVARREAAIAATARRQEVIDAWKLEAARAHVEVKTRATAVAAPPVA